MYHYVLNGAPSEGSLFDKKPLYMAKKIMAELSLKPKEYRKMLTSLRSKINLVETNMSGHQFSQINFEQVPSKCHMINRNAFSRIENSKKEVDLERQVLVSNYLKYKEDLLQKKTTIKVKGLEPHEIVNHYLLRDSPEDQILEAQWSTIVEKTKEYGSFKNCIAISDVSGSMSGQPMLFLLQLVF